MRADLGHLTQVGAVLNRGHLTQVGAVPVRADPGHLCGFHVRAYHMSGVRAAHPVIVLIVLVVFVLMISVKFMLVV